MDELATHDERVPLARYLALRQAADRLCETPAMSLQFGEQVQAMEVSVVCVIGSTCETMRDSVVHINRFARLTMDVDSVHGGDHFLLEHTREGLWYIDD